MSDDEKIRDYAEGVVAARDSWEEICRTGASIRTTSATTTRRSEAMSDDEKQRAAYDRMCVNINRLVGSRRLRYAEVLPVTYHRDKPVLALVFEEHMPIYIEGFVVVRDPAEMDLSKE